jgi:hypothetical protein
VPPAAWPSVGPTRPAPWPRTRSTASSLSLTCSRFHRCELAARVHILRAFAAAAAHFLATFRRRPAASEQLLARPAPPSPPLLRTRPHAPPPPRGKAPLRAPRRDAIPATARSLRRSGVFSPPSRSSTAPRCWPPPPNLRAPVRWFSHGRSRPLAAGGHHRRRDVAAA